MKRYISTITIASSLLFASTLIADETPQSSLEQTPPPKEQKSIFAPNFTYWDVSYNYLDWSSGTERQSTFTDFSYIELEGGAGWDWGEFYFFTDIENPTHDWDDEPTDDKRFVIKPILDVQLYESNWYVHVQDYYLDSNGFFVNNLVTGIAYKFSGENGSFIRPFLGTHYQESTFYDGFNGYIGGWTLIYNFTLADQKMTLSNWHEIEFDRDKEHYEADDGTPIGDGKSWGINGAIALWWTPIKQITAGVQYRYAYYKLGYAGYSNAIIYSFKYNF
ncbi:Putative exported protein precursor [hydrothermal vent metagenome]|uniref:Putative exported protein n=1 Tax=hydrothermal vent metagenome TaxID=652676 RepID=A0A1W1BBT6_9ZZZZ